MSDRQRTQSGRGRGRGQQQQQQPRPSTSQIPSSAPPPQVQVAWGRPQSAIPSQQAPRPAVPQHIGAPRTQVPSPQPQQPAQAGWPRPQQPRPQMMPSQPQIPKRPQTAPSAPQTPQPSELRSTIETLPEEPVQQVVEKLQEIKVAETEIYPQKPKQKCDLGREILLKTNHYGFVVKQSYCLYQYDVKVFTKFTDSKTKKPVEKDIKERDLAKEIFKNLINTIYGAYRNKIVTDFRKNLYSMVDLPQPLLHKLIVMEKEYMIQLTKTTFVNIDPSKPVDQAIINALQLSFTHNFTLNLISLNRSFFKLDAFRKQLGFNLNLWKGFFVSVRPSEMGFNVNIDVANTVFFDEGNIVDLAKKFYNCNEAQISQRIREDRYGEFESQIRNRKVKTHMGYTKRVEGFGPSASEHKFKLPDGTTTTVQTYFSSQKRPLKYPQLPCLKLGKENFTPMEFCTTVRANVSKLDPKGQSEMIKETAVPAEQRKADIEKIMNSLDLNRDPVLQQYNINVDLKMVELKGRILPAPDLEYAQNGILKSQEIGTQGSWRNTGRKFLNTVKIDNWLIINYSRRTDPNDFIDALIRVSSNHGITMSDPKFVENFSNERDPNRALKFIEDTYKKNGNPSFILAILPGTTDIYKALKTFGDLNYGVSTQGIDGDTIYKNRTRGFDQLVSNICLKINPKLGGRNFRLSPRAEMFQKILQKYNDGKVMVFGADVNHTTGGDAESIAAVVGSIDPDFTYYAARLYGQRQPRGQALELIWDLGKMVSSLLDEYYKKNNRYPERILFLRDGVSEGQFSKCLNHEMNQIREACMSKSTSYKPAITFVVVQKRHHTRFFAVNQRDCTRSGNVPPGTMVDAKIVTPDMFDFFLCSHNGIKGTSKPCHYFILHDENNFTMNQISLFCHYLCHIYSRSTTSVSYPAPTYYADLCAARGRDYLRPTKSGIPRTIESNEIILHEKFRNKMFFI